MTTEPTLKGVVAEARRYLKTSGGVAWTIKNSELIKSLADIAERQASEIERLKASPEHLPDVGKMVSLTPALEPGDLERLAGIRRKLVFHHCEGLAHDIACLARFEALADTVEE